MKVASFSKSVRYTRNLQKHEPIVRCLLSISGLFLCAKSIRILHQSESGLFLNSLTDSSQRSKVLISEPSICTQHPGARSFLETPL